MNIRTSTESFEQWLRSQTAVVRADLVEKHRKLRKNAFVFLRGTFYRWRETWPKVCAKLTDAPRVLAVGDLHVENFGTWRDAEGRLVWGVNDVDEAAELAYANDLVRLAASAALAKNEQHLTMTMRNICRAILDGYTASLTGGGKPIVLAERRRWLRDVALSDLRDPKKFWAEMWPKKLNRAEARPPHDAIDAIEAALPAPRLEYLVRHRVAGVGSLGRQRYVAIAEWEGALIAREVKALVPVRPAPQPMKILIENAVRARDPFWSVHGSWIVRRLAPDCSKIEIDDLPKRRNEEKLLRAMGWETANMHLGTPRARTAILRDVRSRHARWLERATADMVDATIADWRAWRRAARS
jgi:Uncharacterized protein conserved in bacteria (DUF2252)